MYLQIILLLGAYLLGSTNFAIILCKIFLHKDPRNLGSHNPGSTNVLRIGNKYIAAGVLICDILKGIIPVFIAKTYGLSLFLQSLVLLFAVIGHMWPIFFAFKGGKGVATTIGGVLVLSPLLAMIMIITWGITFKIYKISALSAIISAILTPIYAYFLLPIYSLECIIFISLLVLYKHRINMQQLWK